MREGTHTCNTGGAFGIFLPQEVLLIGGIAVLVFLVSQYRKEERWMLRWSWLLLVVGGMANLLERWHFGCVMDYIAIAPFPAFNVADIALTVGVAGIFWYYVRGGHKKGV